MSIACSHSVPYLREVVNILHICQYALYDLARYAALATLKRHHEDPFIQAAPLIVETIIEAARRIQQEAEKEKP